MTENVTLQLDEFGHEALDRFARREGSKSAAVRSAAMYYLADMDSGRAAWRVPPRSSAARPAQGLAVRFDAETWTQLESEAARQEVATDVLAVHALLYFLADLDNGRLAARLEDALQDDA